MRISVLLLILCSFGSPAFGAIIYDSTSSPLPGNVPSLGYQATSTDQLGDHIQLAGSARVLTKATVTMSNWAMLSQYPGSDPSGYTHPLTLNIYSVDNSGGTPALGALLASQTVTASIPWKPEPHIVNGVTYNGIAFNVDFDFSSLGVILPDEIIYGLSYDTQTHGDNPLGLPGPYTSLNFGLATGGPSVGTDVNSGSTFWDTLPPFGGNDSFGPNTELSGYTPMIQLQAEVPEPASLAVWSLMGVAGLAYRWRRKSSPVSHS